MGQTIVKALVAVVAMTLVFIVARATVTNSGSHLQVEVDPATGKAVLKVDGGESLPLSAILQNFFERDGNLTKVTVCSWGEPHAVIDAHDADALKKFDLLAANDFWGLWRTLKKRHSAGNARYLKQLAAYSAALEPVEKREVVLTWHSSTEIEGNAILFPQGVPWFAERLDKACDIAIGESRFPAVISGPTRLAGADRIQVSEGTFVRIVSQAEGRRVIPKLGSKEWKAITGRGKVHVELLC